MILVDANLLVYAYNTAMPEHQRAASWLDGVLNGTPRVGLPWPSLLSFARLVTNPRVFSNPATVHDAWDQVRQWLTVPSVWIPAPLDGHEKTLDSLIEHVTASNLVPDAHLAALAIEHGLELCSTDGDFARFPGLRWRNPLV